MFDVKKYGAKGDGQTNDRHAIQAAVDACRDAGGGTVVLPPGTYLSGTIWLRTQRVAISPSVRAIMNDSSGTASTSSVPREAAISCCASRCPQDG